MTTPTLVRLVAGLPDEQQRWNRTQCPRCGGWHPTGPCPCARGVRFVIDHLPGLGWRGCICLPLAGPSDMQLRSEIPSGMLNRIASEGDPQGMLVQGGPQVGLLSTLLNATQTPVGTQAMTQTSNVLAGVGQAVGPMLGGLLGGIGSILGGIGGLATNVLGSVLGGQQPAAGGGAPPSAPAAAPAGAPGAPAQHQPNVPGAILGGLLGGPAGAYFGAQVHGPPASSLGDDLRTIVSMIPSTMPEVPEGRTIGQPYGHADETWLNAMPAEAIARLGRMPVDDPHGLICRTPALLGGHILLNLARQACAMFPELDPLCDVIAQAARILDCEAGRLMGDPDANKSFESLAQSNHPRDLRALEFAQGVMG